MGKLFIRLYSLLAIALAVFVIGTANIADLVHGVMERHAGSLAEGTRNLLEQKLAATPRSQWPALITRLNEGGGYPLRLAPLATFNLPESVIRRLNTQSFTLYNLNNVPYLYKQIDDSDLVLEVPFRQTEHDHNRRLANSTFNLIEDLLRGNDAGQWREIVGGLNAQFAFPVDVVPLAQLSFDGQRQRDLLQGRVAMDKPSARLEHLYRRIGDSDYAVMMGPFDEPLTLSHLQSIILASLALIVAVPVLLWVYPLWRDLKRLGVTATAFGEGDFAARATLAKRSALHTLASTFNQMAVRIQGLISSHRELTNAVSHELRTPIARLRFGMEMLQSAPDAATQQRYAESMNADIDELDTLVEELLTYARFDRQAPDLKLQRQAFAPWLEGVVAHARLHMGDIRLSHHLDGDRWVELDPRLMARAVGNVLRNAARYATSQVSLSVSRDGDDWCICVDDDGPGIPEADRERVFEPFTRLDVSRDRGTGGYGLGLAIVSQVAKWHGGRVSVADSALGGARFSIRWPVTPSA